MPNDSPDDGSQCSGVLNRTEAFRRFAAFAGPTQSQQHIKPLHQYVATRLVLEGGFAPDEIRPHPPLRTMRGTNRLIQAPDQATGAEATILGGLKTKNVDIVVTKDGIGPVLAISCKGMTGAFRNLANRLEETIGECTNIHIGYPMLVFGYLFIARANRADQQTAPTDLAFRAPGQPVESLIRFHAALTEMTGRLGVRNDLSRYESVGMALVDTRHGFAGQLIEEFPPSDSRINFSSFFDTLYRRYDERYVVGAPRLESRTRRVVWAANSPALLEALPASDLDYEIRADI